MTRSSKDPKNCRSSQKKHRFFSRNTGVFGKKNYKFPGSWYAIGGGMGFLRYPTASFWKTRSIPVHWDIPVAMTRPARWGWRNNRPLGPPSLATNNRWSKMVIWKSMDFHGNSPEFTRIWGYSKNGNTPKWLGYKGKSDLEMDDN